MPVTALTRDRDGRQGVLEVVDARTAFRPVQTGASDGERVLVRKGLAAGDVVVAQPQGVKANMRVQALQAARQPVAQIASRRLLVQVARNWNRRRQPRTANANTTAAPAANQMRASVIGDRPNTALGMP